MNGVIGIAQCCCEEVDAVACDVYPSCEEQAGAGGRKLVVPSYATIGRPIGPTIYDGPFWVAWHNGVYPEAQTFFDLSLKIWKRTIVQEDCGGGTCPTAPIPKVTGDCTTASGTLSPSAGCAKTEYVDYYEWSVSEIITLAGGRKDQLIAIQENSETGDLYDGAPPGPWPCYLTDCGASPCADPDAPVNTGDNPPWWPGENRSIVPRYFKSECTITSSAAPSGSYPITAACGAVSFENRCSATTSSRTAQMCVDLPITVVPGHETKWLAGDVAACGFPGSPAAGGGTYGCCVDCFENGGREAAWGLDIKEDGLVTALTNMGFTSSQYVGSLGGGGWMTMVQGNNRVRLLFGMLARLSSGDTFKFANGVDVKESGSFSFQGEGVSYYCEIELTVRPLRWCFHNPRCGCVQSYAENGPTAILVQAFIKPNAGESGECSDCGSSPAQLSYALALNRYDIPSWHFDLGGPYWPSCMQFPVNSACVPFHPPSGFTLEDYVGDTPVERYHPGWQYYRNKYDHYLCVNTIASGGSGCCVGAVEINSTPVDRLCGGACAKMDPVWAAGFPCPGGDPQCINNLQFPQTTPAGCHDVEYVGGSFYASALEPGFCFPCTNHPQWFQCGTLFLGTNCGTALYTDCDCCNAQFVQSLPDVTIVDWDPTTGCYPQGRHDLFFTSFPLICDRSTWVDNGSYAIIS